MRVGLAGHEERRGELGVVRRIGKMLGFQAESGIFGVFAAVAFDSVEKIPGVELDSGLGGEHVHDAAGGGFVGMVAAMVKSPGRG